jgi:hypothetical protein
VTEFAYLSVLISIVIGLGLWLLLSGVAGLIRGRREARLYRPVLIWMAMLYLLHVQIWWAIFELRDKTGWTFFQFMLVLAIPVLAFLCTAGLVPDPGREARIDLKAEYYANRRWFFGILGLLPLASLMQEWAISGGIEIDPDPWFRLGFFALSGVGFVSRHEGVHVFFAPFTLVGFGIYVILLFLRLV